MREIKFRGMNKVTKEWVYGYYIALEEGTSELVECIWQLGAKRAIPIEPRTDGQFTGFYDKNGKEIYEGDIVDIGISLDRKMKTYISVVQYDDEMGCFKVEHPNIILLGTCEKLEIIGNIYEHSELLGE